MLFEDYVITVDGCDKTDSVKQWKKTANGYDIVFNSNDKVYSYGGSRVEIVCLKEKIDCASSRVFVNDALQENVLEIHDYGKLKKMFFKNGQRRIITDEKFHIEENCLQIRHVAEKFYYLKELAEEIGLPCDDGASILSKYYRDIDFIGTNSVMGFYLSRRDDLDKMPLPNPIIFPFGLNQSQKKAVSCALSSRISIIEGPPGTGKTQTILNIIANLVLQGKTVAIAASNNSATDNILEKLAKNNFDFFCAPLGSGKNKEKFITNQSESYPDISSWRMPAEELANLKTAIAILTTELDEMLEVQNQIAQVRQESSELEQERKYFVSYLGMKKTQSPPQKPKLKGSHKDILNLWIEYENFAEKSRIQGLWFRIKKVFFYGWDSFSFLNQPAEQVIPTLQSLFYEIYKKELDDKRIYLEKKLSGYRFEDKMQEIKLKSTRLFKGYIAACYRIDMPRTLFKKDELYRSPENFLKEYPVVLSTTHSIRNSLSKKCMFDYIIIDEASQVDILTGALSFANAKNAIIVGDLMQLPNVITPQDMQRSLKIEDKYNIENEYRYTRHSLLSSASSVWQKIPKTLLREHYRCHPQIIGFCNKKFYNNQLVIMTKDRSEQDVLKLYYTLPGNHARKHLNQRQLDVIKGEILPELAAPDDSTGIITPYRAQANALSNQEQTSELESDTVHKYQGREKENIIISTVDDKIGEFADNPNLLNVAVSRAIRRLRVVVSPDADNENTNTGDLIKYIRRHNFEVVQSEISSIFDLLYKQYAQKRLELLKKYKSISEYDSENLANTLIEKVLVEKSFSKLDFTCHYPLSKLLHNVDRLLEKQRKYALHPATHVDFIIFNKMDKMPILAIEIDGTSYHKEGSIQYARDRMKDEILKRYNIPILRLATNGSSEEQRIRSKLSEILKVEGIPN
ncbi:AAA domain-containing protein [Desulfovibrio intestinalis]|uniref:Superfamily I DNA and/or RNA helicase n=1 Tax=Desulfovibrio intestinalis TaxID=58621 RepID=A0A7W8FDV2_9BACT|nr:superfamily I DNA and/or RNA helicase [Desulfovibrio intestinalis]